MASANVPSELPSFVRSILKGGGGETHSKMKLAGWFWLKSEGCKLIAFETGGFDVLGFSRSMREKERREKGIDVPCLYDRFVIDAKSKKSDIPGHFKKKHVPLCDIEEWKESSWFTVLRRLGLASGCPQRGDDEPDRDQDDDRGQPPEGGHHRGESQYAGQVDDPCLHAPSLQIIPAYRVYRKDWLTA